MSSVSPQARIDGLLKGAVDLHTHPGPSLHPRKLDHIEVLREAEAAGFRAVLLKDHYYPTMPAASLLNKHLGLKCEALGAIVLNNPLGGLNPAAVDYALRQGARVIWMATAHAENHLEHERREAEFKNQFPQNTARTLAARPLRLTDAKGQVLDVVKQILDLVAEADAMVSAGHHHFSELVPFYAEAKARGVQRLFLNHPTFVNDVPVDEIGGLTEMGVMIEHSICMFVPSTFHIFDDAHLDAVIRAGGVENTFFGSDLGQMNNPTPVEGFRQLIAKLIALGYDDDQIRLMTTANAARLAGLD